MRRHTLDSSNIVAVSYSRKMKLLTVEFWSGSIYIYRNVPYWEYLRLLNIRKKGGSHGSYFAANIRDKYDYAKIDPAKLPDELKEPLKPFIHQKEVTHEQ